MDEKVPNVNLFRSTVDAVAARSMTELLWQRSEDVARPYDTLNAGGPGAELIVEISVRVRAAEPPISAREKAAVVYV